MKRIKLLIKNVGESCIEAVIEGDILQELQNIVGGYIDAYPLSPRNAHFPKHICCICNEDGNLKGFPKNIYDFVGNVVIVARGEEDFESLSEADIKICKELLNNAEPDKPQLFDLGMCTATAGASKLLDKDQMFHLLERHVTGDFGDLCEEDNQVNQRAIKYGERIFSRYEIFGGTFYVITEADRSVTTILLTEEY